MVSIRKVKRGQCKGQQHHKAVLSDREVEIMRRIYESGEMTYRELSLKFDISIWAVGKICRYERR